MKCLIIAALLVTLASAQSLTYTSCADGACATGCTNTTVPQGQCTAITGSSASDAFVTATVSGSEAGCWSFDLFDSPDCTTASAGPVKLSGTCNTCSNGVIGTCGALPFTVVFSYECNPDTQWSCGNCGNTVRLPFNKCTKIPNLAVPNFGGYQYAMPKFGSIGVCPMVNVQSFAQAACGAVTATTAWPAGKCVAGSMYSIQN